MRSRRLPSSDDIWIDLWERIRARIDAAGGLRGDRRSPTDPDPVPRDPNRPNTLRGGAAAQLDLKD